MTQDQIHHRLCNKELLKKVIGNRTKKVSSDGVLTLLKMDSEGKIKARDRDGNPIKLKSIGKSLVSQIREREQKETQRKKPRRKRK